MSLVRRSLWRNATTVFNTFGACCRLQLYAIRIDRQKCRALGWGEGVLPAGGGGAGHPRSRRRRVCRFPGVEIPMKGTMPPAAGSLIGGTGAARPRELEEHHTAVLTCEFSGDDGPAPGIGGHPQAAGVRAESRPAMMKRTCYGMPSELSRRGGRRSGVGDEPPLGLGPVPVPLPTGAEFLDRACQKALRLATLERPHRLTQQHLDRSRQFYRPTFHALPAPPRGSLA